jgi:hypothetical protein
MLPPILPIGFSSILYLFLLYIIGTGFWQFFSLQTGKQVRIKSLVPLGAAALVISLIVFVQQYRMVFQSIEEQGDISPGIVAAGFKDALSYPIMGLLSLAMAFVFKYLNNK